MLELFSLLLLFPLELEAYQQGNPVLLSYRYGTVSLGKVIRYSKVPPLKFFSHTLVICTGVCFSVQAPLPLSSV